MGGSVIFVSKGRGGQCVFYQPHHFEGLRPIFVNLTLRHFFHHWSSLSSLHIVSYFAGHDAVQEAKEYKALKVTAVLVTKV